jgi:transcriptional regulator with GAF, ATPase, and Fis domain
MTPMSTPDTLAGISPIIGNSPTLQAVRRAIAQVASTDATVLVLGETGTGKELVARAIHDQSSRRSKNFVPVSGIALAPGLVASELFGHEAGAFTGAARRHVGRFEQAHGGTLFLDEVGELTPDTQAVLLRALQERVIDRVGGGPVAVDVRVIAATNRDLGAEVKAGRFRADLYYRLAVFPITVPPLRDRRSDIPALVENIVRELSSRHGRSVTRIRPSILRALAAHSWPGNVRELRNVIERSVIASEDDDLAFDPGWLVGASVAETAKTWASEERQRIVDALHAAGGRVYGPGGAAHRLGLNPTTLYGKMRKHGISRTGVSWG